MANYPTTADTLISSREAENYVDNYLSLKNCLQENILNQEAASSSSTPPCVANTEVFYNNNSNAFIFDVAQLNELLTTRDRNDELPGYLMVFLGAKYKEETVDQNTPTIVLAGVNYDESNESFYSMDLEKPAMQQPPPLTNFHFPAIKE